MKLLLAPENVALFKMQKRRNFLGMIMSVPYNKLQMPSHYTPLCEGMHYAALLLSLRSPATSKEWIPATTKRRTHQATAPTFLHH